MKKLCKYSFILLMILSFFTSCENEYESMYLELLAEKEQNEKLLQESLNLKIEESSYQTTLNKLMHVDHLKDKEYESNLDFYFEFEIHPPFNMDRKRYIISSNECDAFIIEVNYNIDMKCNIVIGDKPLDFSCLSTFEKDSIPISLEEVEELNKNLDYYEF